jgi:transposase
MALGGAAGVRLAHQFGIETSEPTVLRQLRSSHAERATPAPRVVGIDDWAWRKGHRYGTILCDLERGRVIDMLADRSSASTEQWMRRHPGIEIVSRDRASLYAEAADKALPHAVQVAGRWYLLRNLSEALTNSLAPHHRTLNEAARALQPELPFPPPEEVCNSAVKYRTEAARQRNRERRLNRYEAVMEQLRQGSSQAATSRILGIDRRTVRRWSGSHGFPERRPVLRRSCVDRYEPYLRSRWEQGCRNTTQLWRELRERGFAGQRKIVYNWIRQHLGPVRKGRDIRQCNRVPRASPRRTAWLILKNPEESRPYIDELFRVSPEIAALAAVAREFVRMIRDRDAAAWQPWLASALCSPLVGFARHLRRDEAAVLAALKTQWSNGPVEGHVHRLKLIKRSMYGRARFDLLRIRVLGLA